MITSARKGETSRVFHPLRRGASECSAKGRSATRSDSQRLRERTRWDGHPAWGFALRPLLAQPWRAANGGGGEKNGGESSDFSVFTLGRPWRRKLRGRSDFRLGAFPGFPVSTTLILRSESPCRGNPLSTFRPGRLIPSRLSPRFLDDPKAGRPQWLVFAPCVDHPRYASPPMRGGIPGSCRVRRWRARRERFTVSVNG